MLHADQEFLDCLYEFPAGYLPLLSLARRPPGRTRLGKSAVKKILTVTCWSKPQKETT